VRELFGRARALQPCVLFLDELGLYYAALPLCLVASSCVGVSMCRCVMLSCCLLASSLSQCLLAVSRAVFVSVSWAPQGIVSRPQGIVSRPTP